ncbi:hypothetical protein G7046_g1823 [Stylonectria norvegica]|nr:hypothetical protein G7046_g1823 [Stylonectria norvegica]
MDMDMDSSSMAMTIATSSATDSSSMPTSTTSSGMAGNMGMEDMAMVFFTSTNTPLWSTAFSPKTTGQYAGTCIFLICFATIFRLLLAFRVNFFKILAADRHRRDRGLLQPDTTNLKDTTRPWRANEAIMLGTMDMVIAGVSYLLMLAVMTMNVGYFTSILGGVFVGSVLCGRYTANSGAH